VSGTDLNLARLVATAAALDGVLATDPFSATTALEYRLAVDAAAGPQTARLELGGLPPPARSWTRFGGVLLTFGPDADWISDGQRVGVATGGLMLTDQTMPARALAIRFGAVASTPPSVAVHLDCLLTTAASPTRFTLDAEALLGPVRVHADTPTPDPTACRQLAARYLDLPDYLVEPSLSGLLLIPKPATPAPA
jgi:hypothetical protein